jgi:hypothetical protein
VKVFPTRAGCCAKVLDHCLAFFRACPAPARKPSVTILGNRFDQGWVSVPVDEGAERHREVNVFIAVSIPHVRPLAALSRTIGPEVYTVAPREGEFTPSTSDCWARSNHC